MFERGSNGAFTAPREHQPMVAISRRCRRSTECAQFGQRRARRALLAPQLRFAQRTRQQRIATGIASKNNEMRFARGSAWVGVVRWWRRAPQCEFGPEDGG